LNNFLETKFPFARSSLANKSARKVFVTRMTRCVYDCYIVKKIGTLNKNKKTFFVMKKVF